MNTAPFNFIIFDLTDKAGQGSLFVLPNPHLPVWYIYFPGA